jgi:hypothetical protein
MNPNIHDQWTFTPPHGTRFSIYGSDVQFQFEKTRADEMISWLKGVLEAAVSQVAQRKMDAVVESEVAVVAPAAPQSTAGMPGLVMQVSEAQAIQLQDRARLLLNAQLAESSTDKSNPPVAPSSDGTQS